MITIITTVLGVFFKFAQVAAKVALNRTTVILTFVATIGTTIALIYNSLTTVGGVLHEATGSISSASVSLASWVQNEYVQSIGYALSLDSLTDGIVTTFVFVVCTLTGFLLTSAFGAFVAVLPLFADLALSGIKNQMARTISIK